jgi:hypothetical protein
MAMVSGYIGTSSEYIRVDEILDASDNSEVTMSMAKADGSGAIEISAKNTDAVQYKRCYGVAHFSMVS